MKSRLGGWPGRRGCGGRPRCLRWSLRRGARLGGVGVERGWGVVGRDGERVVGARACSQKVHRLVETPREENPLREDPAPAYAAPGRCARRQRHHSRSQTDARLSERHRGDGDPDTAPTEAAAGGPWQLARSATQRPRRATTRIFSNTYCFNTPTSPPSLNTTIA